MDWQRSVTWRSARWKDGLGVGGIKRGLPGWRNSRKLGKEDGLSFRNAAVLSGAEWSLQREYCQGSRGRVQTHLCHPPMWCFRLLTHFPSLLPPLLYKSSKLWILFIQPPRTRIGSDRLPHYELSKMNRRRYVLGLKHRKNHKNVLTGVSLFLGSGLALGHQTLSPGSNHHNCKSRECLWGCVFPLRTLRRPLCVAWLMTSVLQRGAQPIFLVSQEAWQEDQGGLGHQVGSYQSWLLGVHSEGRETTLDLFLVSFQFCFSFFSPSYRIS